MASEVISSFQWGSMCTKYFPDLPNQTSQWWSRVPRRVETAKEDKEARSSWFPLIKKKLGRKIQYWNSNLLGRCPSSLPTLYFPNSKPYYSVILKFWGQEYYSFPFPPVPNSTNRGSQNTEWMNRWEKQMNTLTRKTGQSSKIGSFFRELPP